MDLGRTRIVQLELLNAAFHSPQDGKQIQLLLDRVDVSFEVNRFVARRVSSHGER
jgi:hypothetical protein